MRLLGMVLSKLLHLRKTAVVWVWWVFSPLIVKFTPSVTQSCVARLNLAYFQLLAYGFSMYYSNAE